MIRNYNTKSYAQLHVKNSKNNTCYVSKSDQIFGQNLKWTNYLKKEEKMDKKQRLKRYLALLLALVMLIGIVPTNIFAQDPTTPNQGSNLPSNRVQKVNWAKEYDKTSNIWKLNQAYNLDPAQQLAKVSAADPIDNYGLSYEGYFVNAEGRTVLRLVYHESSSLASGVWHNLLFKFDKDLFPKIDFSKSFIEYFNGNKLQFYDVQGSNEKALKIRDLIWQDRSGWKHNMPIDLVLNDGVKYSDLNDNYLIQMRFATPKLDKIYTFAPGKSPMDYSTYTKSTIVAAKSDVDTAFMRGPKPQSPLIVTQRSFMTEYDNEPQTINQLPNEDKSLAVLKTQYQWEHRAMGRANTIDGKPFGYMIAFDASLVPYLKEDVAGNVGYTTLQNANKVENKGNAQYPYIKTALKSSQINYTHDKKIAYFVLAEDNFKKANVKIVRIKQMDGSIYQGNDNFTNIDFVVDKNKFINEVKSTSDQEQIRFGVVAGWVESNPKGMTIFEKTFDKDVVIPEGGSLNIDTNGAPEGGQIMVQVGDGDNFIKRYQPYYNALKNPEILNGFDGMTLLAKGIYSVPYRSGITIKTGQKLRVYMPDTADNDDVRLFYLNNATGWNKGGVNLSFDNKAYNGEINVHIGEKPRSVELTYTLKGQSTPKTTKFTRGFAWNHNGGGELKTINAALLDTGGDYILYKSMLEPGTEVIAKAYPRTGEAKVSSIKYDAFKKSDKRYNGLVITDNSDVLSSLAINKSVLVPYQQVYTNDYAQGQDDFYKTVDAKPTSKDAFNTKTTQLVGYASYDGGPVRLRLLPNNNKTYLGKADAAESVRDKDGFITDPKTTKITVDGKDYDKYEYTVNIADMVDSNDNTTKIPAADQALKKDMRILVSNSDGSSIPSDWYETRVRTRVLFDANKDFNWNIEATSIDSTVKIVPDSAKFFDEDGYTANGFSVSSGAYLKDIDGKDLTGTDLDLRKWPANPKPFTKDGKTYKFLGWSTKKVTPEEFAKAEKLTKLEQWKDTKAYKVTEDSPIDSHQIVYGVWDEGIKIYLHSNNGADEANETVKELVVLASDFNNGIANIDIPKVPYWNGDDSVTDKDMKKFINETEFDLPNNQGKDIRHTFVGWSTDRDDKDLLAGFNYSELAKDNSTLPDDRRNKLSEEESKAHSFKLDTLGKYSYQYANTKTGNTVDKTTQLMLPNGYKLRLDGTYDEWLNKDYIHLYAQYRPFFGIEVNKDYKYIEKENTKDAKYVDKYTDTQNKVHTISEADKRNVLIGLLFRTAVTDYTDPTVHAAAKYFIIEKNKYEYNRYGGYDLRHVYDTPTNTEAKFVVPGFDELGQRLSYSAVETKVGEEDKYYNFKNDWAELGVVIYTRIPAPGQPSVNEGPIVPGLGNEARREAKIQYFEIDDNNNDTFDAFTSATIRRSIKNKGKGTLDIKGYSINMINVPREIPKPQFDKIYDGDTVAYIDIDGIDTKTTYAGLSLTLPGENFKREYQYDRREGKWKEIIPSSAVIGYSVDIQAVKVDGKDKIKITRTETFNQKPFKADEQIKAEFGVDVGNFKNTYGPEGSITVLKLPTNIPVEKVIQEKNEYNDVTDKKHEHPQVVISSKIPAGTGGVLYEPEAGTIYTLVKEDGSEIVDKNNQPVTYEKTAGQQQGTTITFPSFDPAQNGLKHKDKVYIKTTLPDKDGRTFAPVTSTAFAELIIQGPIDKIKYQDDYYRRWLDVTVDMKDGKYPVVGKFTITIDFKDGSTAKTINNITSMEKVQEILKELYRDDNIKKITVVGEDKFGNKSTNEVEYKEPKQIEVKFIMPRAKDKQIKVSGPVGTEVTVTINPGTSTKKEHKITLSDGLNTIPLTTPIKKKDRISIYGEQKESGKIVGKTNPMTFTVRR